MNAIVDKGWTPRALPGGIYCSPRCGGGCKRRAFARATKEAEKLCRRLGDGWEPEVWENLGWHFAAKNGLRRVTVQTNGPKREGDYKITGYTAWINTEHQFIASGKTAEDALGFVTQDARTFVARLTAELNR